MEFHTYTPPDSRLDLVRRIESAPREHAAAVLEAYDLLQRLHDTGALGLVNGLLSAEGTVIGKVTDVVSSKASGDGFAHRHNSWKRADIDRCRIAFTQRSQRPRRIHLPFGNFFAPHCSKEVRKAAGLGLSLAQIFGASLLARKSTSDAGPATGSK